MKKARKLNVPGLAKLQAFLAGLVGMLCGIFYSFGGLVIDILVSAGWLSPSAMSTPGLSFGTLLAFGALIGMPVIFAAVGWLLGIVEAALYNLFASVFGGLKFVVFDEIEE